MSNNKIEAEKSLHHQKCLLAMPIKVAQEVTSQRTDDKLFRNHRIFLQCFRETTNGSAKSVQLHTAPDWKRYQT